MIRQKKLTVESLCHAIDTVMNDATMRENAAILCRLLREEDGTSNAVAFITKWMNDDTHESKRSKDYSGR